MIFLDFAVSNGLFGHFLNNYFFIESIGISQQRTFCIFDAVQLVDRPVYL